MCITQHNGIQARFVLPNICITFVNQPSQQQQHHPLNMVICIKWWFVYNCTAGQVYLYDVTFWQIEWNHKPHHSSNPSPFQITRLPALLGLWDKMFGWSNIALRIDRTTSSPTTGKGFCLVGIIIIWHKLFYGDWLPILVCACVLKRRSVLSLFI